MCLFPECCKCCKNVVVVDLYISPFACVIHKCLFSVAIPQNSLHSLYLYFVHCCMILNKYDLKLIQNRTSSSKPSPTEIKAIFNLQRQFWVLSEGILCYFYYATSVIAVCLLLFFPSPITAR